jgi:hypothetical protein
VTVEPTVAGRRGARWPVGTALVFGLGLLLRFGLVLASRGGPGGAFDYDASVYYAAADALTHGRLPYRDFVLLHPPGLMLSLTPFAGLGRLTSDHAGFLVGNVAFALLGAVDAALVVQIARRMRLPRAAALAGGLFYAVWFGAVEAEFAIRLEALSSFAFLCGAFALAGREPGPSRRSLILGGFAFGAAASVKIWWIVPAGLALLWQLRSAASRRNAPPLGLGMLCAAAVIDGPFFVLAPKPMWQMVVVEQLGRSPSYTSTLRRLDWLTTLHSALPRLAWTSRVAALAAIAVVALGLAIAAWRCRPCRLFVTIAAAQVIVLILAPSYFPFYDGYLAASLALVVAGAAACHPHPAGFLHRIGPAAAALTITAAATATVLAVFAWPVTVVQPFPGRTLAGRVARVRCVMSDSPMALIELDALSRDFADHCPNWVDVTGRTYGVDAPPAAHVVRRPHNVKWQADLRRYLLSGEAVIVIRRGTGLAPATRRAIERLPVLGRAGVDVVHAVPHQQ